MKEETSDWSLRTKTLVKELHSILTIDDRDWHKLKNNSDKRAAELLISALSQLVNKGKTTDVQLIINQALLWLNNEIKDPGCPSKK